MRKHKSHLIFIQDQLAVDLAFKRQPRRKDISKSAITDYTEQTDPTLPFSPSYLIRRIEEITASIHRNNFQQTRGRKSFN